MGDSISIKCTALVTYRLIYKATAIGVFRFSGCAVKNIFFILTNETEGKILLKESDQPTILTKMNSFSR
jgi:hypothetical protein